MLYIFNVFEILEFFAFHYCNYEERSQVSLTPFPFRSISPVYGPGFST